MLKKVLIFMQFCIVTLVAAVPARADIEEWLPDFGQWAEKGLKPYFDLVFSKIRECYEFIVGGIKKAVDGIIEFFQGIWSKIAEFFTGIIQLLGQILNWFKDTMTSWYLWAVDSFTKMMEWLGETFEKFWETLVEFVEWVGRSLFDFLIDMLDWFIGLMLTFIEWLIDQLPEIEMPAGFDEGMNWFLEMGMAFNTILPVSETLQWLAVYLSVVLTVTVYRIIKSFIPGIST